MVNEGEGLGVLLRRDLTRSSEQLCSGEAGFQDARIKQHSLQKQCVGNIYGVMNSCQECNEK